VTHLFDSSTSFSRFGFFQSIFFFIDTALSCVSVFVVTVQYLARLSLLSRLQVLEAVALSVHCQCLVLPRAFSASLFPTLPSTLRIHHASSSNSNFVSVFETAIKAYKERTGQDITSHPLSTSLKTCDSPDAILAVLRAQVQEFDQSRKDDERLTKWLNPTVNVLYAFSATLGEGVGLVFSPAKVIFAGIGVLLLASKDVAASHDVLVNIFERIENFFKRLEAYTEVPQTGPMTDVIVNIMVEVLSISR